MDREYSSDMNEKRALEVVDTCLKETAKRLLILSSAGKLSSQTTSCPIYFGRGNSNIINSGMKCHVS